MAIAPSIVYRKSSGGIVFDKSRVLLVEVTYPYREYIFPKGTVEVGETLEETAVREVSEETGYSTKIVTSLSSLQYEFVDGGVRVIKTVHYYLMALKDPAETPKQNLQEGEYIRAKWVTIPDALDILTYENSKDLLLKAVELYQHRSNDG